MRFAREGYAYLAASVAFTLFAALMGWTWVTIAAAIMTALVANFFRDPDRLIPPGGHVVTSPADGKVVAILDDITEERFIKGPCRRVSIFMSPLDVHVNRMPTNGTVVDVRHQSGKFHAAFLDKASELNEQNAVLIENARGERFLCVQIAGQLARRIVCHVRPGDEARRGERYGMIMFGSRLDLYVPPRVEIQVKIGDRVSGGSSVIGIERSTGDKSGAGA